MGPDAPGISFVHRNNANLVTLGAPVQYYVKEYKLLKECHSMKYQETYLGTKAEFGEFIKRAIPDLFSGKLSIEGKPVSLPSGKELDYKLKYDEDEQGGSISIKVGWSNEVMVMDLEE